MIKTKYLDKHIPSLKGKTYIVTGANGGLGLITSMNLVYKGAHVIMLCHDGDEDKRKKVTEHIYSLISQDLVTILFYEQASLKSIDEVVNKIKNIKHVDGVSLNAGVYYPGKGKKTLDGYSMTIGVNFIGTYYLLNKLIDIYPTARFDIVGSIYTKKIKIKDINHILINGLDGQGQEYASSKYLLMSLSSFLFKNNKTAKFTCSHPGATATNIIRGLPKLINKLGGPFMKAVFNSPEKSSLCSTFALAGDNVNNGNCYFPSGLFNVWGYPHRTHLRKRFTKESAVLIREIDKFFREEIYKK